MEELSSKSLRFRTVQNLSASVLKTVQKGFTYQAKLNSHLLKTCQLYANHRRFVWNWALGTIKKRRQAKALFMQELTENFHMYDGEGYDGDFLLHVYPYSTSDLSKELTQLKKGKLAWLNQSPVEVHTQALADLQKALQAFWK